MWGFIKQAAGLVWKGVKSKKFREIVLPLVVAHVRKKVSDKEDNQ